MRMLVLSLIMTLTIVSIESLIPNYIIPCHGSDPKFNECIVNSAKIAFPEILKGDKDFRIPCFSPFHYPKMIFKPNENLEVLLTDVTLTGLETIVGKEFSIDLKNKKVTSNCKAKIITFYFHYEMDGQLLVLPIKGDGYANVTYMDVDIKFLMEYDLETKGDGKKYAYKFRSQLGFNISKSYYQFNNLFNGNKILGDNVNRFLNENSEEINSELGTSIGEVISSVIVQYMESVLNKIPYNELILP